jgi:hypothetical protein
VRFLFKLQFARTQSPSLQVRKRHFLRHLYIKCIILPRQAWDKHRENSKKCRFPSATGAVARCLSSLLVPQQRQNKRGDCGCSNVTKKLHAAGLVECARLAKWGFADTRRCSCRC